MVRNRKVVCLVCERSMDSDKLKRHTRIHKDLLSLSEDEVKKELRERHDIKMERSPQQTQKQYTQTRAAKDVSTRSGLNNQNTLQSIRT